MARNHYQDLERIRSLMEDARRLDGELKNLLITNPDSPRVAVLEKEVASVASLVERELEAVDKNVQESERGLEKAESLSFDVQKQLTTLSATLIVALLALSEVFEGTPGLQAAVGDASGALIYAIGASLLTMVFYTFSSIDYRALRMPAQGPVHKRVANRLLPYFGPVIEWLRVISMGFSFLFFFWGLLTLATFLSGD